MTGQPTIYAVSPRGDAWRIHLYVEGYQPRAAPWRRPKKRGIDTPLCGAYVASFDTARKVPLKEALRWPDGPRYPDDPGPPRRWCPSCLGHAADLLGLANNLARTLAWEDHISSSHGPRVQGQMVTWAQQTSSSDHVVMGGTPVTPIKVERCQ